MNSITSVIRVPRKHHQGSASVVGPLEQWKTSGDGSSHVFLPLLETKAGDQPYHWLVPCLASLAHLRIKYEVWSKSAEHPSDTALKQ